MSSATLCGHCVAARSGRMLCFSGGATGVMGSHEFLERADCCDVGCRISPAEMRRVNLVDVFTLKSLSKRFALDCVRGAMRRVFSPEEFLV